ncbi:hypothetical protein L208DRAFT_1364050 [Tricholoma matsutake]|nr:hypothetical protein L208DRAFT_1364050 [Tricholoma matsutake 945]
MPEHLTYQKQLSPLQELNAHAAPLQELNAHAAPLQELNAHAAPLQEINAHAAPILRLPPEITSEVFLAYFVDHAWNRATSQPVSELPLLFGRICRTWREVAWSTPRLWNKLQINLLFMQNSSLVDQWLSRSCTLPLSIRIVCHDHSPDFGQSVLPILQIITSHAEKWHSISFTLPGYIYDVLQCVKNRLHNLQRIVIDTQHDAEVKAADIFSNAPQLCEAHIGIFRPHRFPLPLSQLKKLSLDAGNAGQCLDILRHSPHVVICTLSNLKALGSVRQTHARQLEILQLSFSYLTTNSISDVLASLTLPAAREFACTAFGQQFPQFPCFSLLSLIHRSSCTLQILRLSCFDINDHDLFECLRAIPSLHTLSLINMIITGPMFRTLSLHDSSPADLACILLPHLKKFEYLFEIFAAIDVPDIAIISRFLRSRWEVDESSGVTKLHNVNIRTPGWPDAHVSHQIQCMRNEGMDIKFVVYHNLSQQQTSM